MRRIRTHSVCLLQPYPAPYRMGLFNELNRQLNGGLTVVYFAKEEAARQWIFERNAEFSELSIRPAARPTGYESARVRLRFFGFIRVLMKIRPSVVISVEHPVGRVVRLAQVLFRFKLLYWTETNEITLCGAQQKRWLTRWVDRGASAYIVPGRWSEQYVRSIRNYSGRIWRAPNTIDRRLFACSAEEVMQKFRENELRFLFSGSLIELKGIHSLLEVFRLLADTAGIPPYRLDIIGEGPLDKKPLRNVHYHGYLSQDECAVFMKQAHVLILPSLRDCSPLVVTEAVAAGCLTVLSDGVGNWPEYTDGNGFVFERGNADALYETLLKVLGLTREDRLRMALRSLEIAAAVSHENSASVFVRAIQQSLVNSDILGVGSLGQPA